MSFVRAFVEGVAYYKKHKAESVEMIREFLRVNDTAVGEEAYYYFGRITPAKPYTIIEGIRTVVDEIALTDPSAKNAKPEQFVDSGFLAKLDKSGYIDRLYKK